MQHHQLPLRYLDQMKKQGQQLEVLFLTRAEPGAPPAPPPAPPPAVPRADAGREAMLRALVGLPDPGRPEPGRALRAPLEATTAGVPQLTGTWSGAGLGGG